MKKIIYAVIIIFVGIFAQHSMAYEKEIKNLSSALSENIAKAGKKNIAVVDFTDLDGNVTKLGRFLAEEFSVALLGTAQGFEVVDRTHLKTLLQEHKLSATGLLDPATARKLGQIAGVESLITGTITSFGETVRLSVKILDANTAKLIGANTSDIPKTKAIDELLAQGIDFGDSAKNASDSPVTTSKSTGKQIKFTNKVITKGAKGENEFIKFYVQSLTIVQDGRIRLDVTWENINQDKLPIEIKLIDPQKNLYLIDDIGHEYTYIESESATENKITIKPGAKKMSSFIFSQIQLGANSVTLYIDFWGQREGKSDYTERFIVDGLGLK